MAPALNYPNPHLYETEFASGTRMHIARDDPRFVPCEPGGCYHVYHTLAPYRQPVVQPPPFPQSTVQADVLNNVRIGYIFSDFDPSAISKQIRDTEKLLPTVKLPWAVCSETTIKEEAEDFIESDDSCDSDATVCYRPPQKSVSAEEAHRTVDSIVQSADIPDDYIDAEKKKGIAELEN
ncbi:hypothetical protein AAVH_18307 [Aphelenchoides avenae]|nr:hypothetical protein AAVH_18307 [Aphelenchus avenae]